MDGAVVAAVACTSHGHDALRRHCVDRLRQQIS